MKSDLELSLNIKYLGEQEQLNGMPSLPTYTDLITKSTFLVLPHQFVSEALEICRNRFKNPK